MSGIYKRIAVQVGLGKKKITEVKRAEDVA
jgi:hypothetical protein